MVPGEMGACFGFGGKGEGGVGLLDLDGDGDPWGPRTSSMSLDASYKMSMMSWYKDANALFLMTQYRSCLEVK